MLISTDIGVQTTMQVLDAVQNARLHEETKRLGAERTRALGVALGYAVQLINQAALNEFAAAVVCDAPTIAMRVGAIRPFSVICAKIASTPTTTKERR